MRTNLHEYVPDQTLLGCSSTVRSHPQIFPFGEWLEPDCHVEAQAGDHDKPKQRILDMLGKAQD